MQIGVPSGSNEKRMTSPGSFERCRTRPLLTSTTCTCASGWISSPPRSATAQGDNVDVAPVVEQAVAVHPPVHMPQDAHGRALVALALAVQVVRLVVLRHH